jgi:hypothetical protein
MRDPQAGIRCTETLVGVVGLRGRDTHL